MLPKSFASEVNFIDAFLAQPKTLDGAPPEFGEKQRGKGRRIWEAVWPIAETDNVVSGGQLRFSYSPASDKPFTLAVIYRKRCVYRIDYVESSICHANPLWAAQLGVPPEVCGPHVHDWATNRGYVLDGGERDLPCRVPIPPEIKKFGDALPWIAEKINLTLTPDQRSFAMPEALF